jgi:hypothetical protein
VLSSSNTKLFWEDGSNRTGLISNLFISKDIGCMENLNGRSSGIVIGEPDCC